MESDHAPSCVCSRLAIPLKERIERGEERMVYNTVLVYIYTCTVCVAYVLHTLYRSTFALLCVCIVLGRAVVVGWDGRWGGGCHADVRPVPVSDCGFVDFDSDGFLLFCL